MTKAREIYTVLVSAAFIVVVVAAWMNHAFTDPRLIPPEEKTYLTKTVPHEGRNWNWVKSDEKFFIGGGEGKITQIPDNSERYPDFEITLADDVTTDSIMLTNNAPHEGFVLNITTK